MTPTGGQGPETVGQCWPSYLASGYFDAQSNLKIEYVGRKWVEPLVKAMCQASNGLTSHQIRRYFGHCRAVESRLKSGASWGSVLADIQKLDVAAADGIAKRPSKIPKLFHDFIRRNVAAIRTKEDFLNGFLPHFEALIGFGAIHLKKERS